MAAAPGGLDRIAKALSLTLFRARVPVLALIALILLAGLDEGGFQPAASAAAIFFVPCAIFFGFAYACLRHSGLAVLAATAPLPGFLWASVISAHYANSVLPLLSLCYSLTFTIALFLADEFSKQIRARGDARQAASVALLQIGCVAGTLAIVAEFVLVLFLLIRRESGPLLAAASLALLAGTASSMLVVPLGASMLRFSEEFVTRANRAGERRERLLNRLAAVAQPRFGWSVSGVTFVLLVLAVFGAQGLRLAAPVRNWMPIAPLLLVLLLWLVAIAALRDWRRGIAATVVSAGSGLMGCWICAREGDPLNLSSLLVLAEAIVIGFGLNIFVAVRAVRDLPSRYDVAAETQNVLPSSGVPALFCGVAVATASSLLCRDAIVTSAAAGTIVVLAAIGAVVVQPALTIVIESLVPRKISKERRYRLGHH